MSRHHSLLHDAERYHKIGATSGIGRALSSKMIGHGSSVIGVGRRQENLDEYVKEEGSKASSSRFDITNLSEIPSWAASINKAHPDLDLVIINSGIQRGFNFAKPDTVDLDLVMTEYTTNYLAYIHIAMAFLPYLQERSKRSPTGIAFTTSGLALTPMLRCPNYCASKAALHHWILTFREQLKQASSNVKCIEIIPPAVQTELHDEKHQPDMKNGRSIGMPLDEFTEKAWAQLVEGADQVPVGMAASPFQPGGFEHTRQQIFQKMNGVST